MKPFDTLAERAANIAAGLCVAVAGGSGVLQSLAAAAVSGVGLGALFLQMSQSRRVDCTAYLSKLTHETKAVLLQNYPAWDRELDDAAARLAAALANSFPDPERIPGLAFSTDGFVAAGTRAVLDDLKLKGAGFDRDPKYEALARLVITEALEAAMRDREFFTRMEPMFWTEALKALAVLSTGMSAIRESQSRLESRAQNVHYRPPLDLRLRDSDAGRSFFFASEGRTPFVGRSEEILALKSWLDLPATFSWSVLTGPGGSGKSRLALELCIEADSAGWHAGFLPSTSALADPERFIDFAADQPTLIVIDYAAEAPERVGQILHTLKDLVIIQALRAPLRVLLVERNAEHASWLARVSGAEEQKLAPFSARLGADRDHLSLRALEDDLLWEIMLHIWAGRPLHERHTALSKLHEIDPEGRPLFAQLVSDAVKHGADLGQLTKPGLLNDLILREKRRWRHLFVGNDAALIKNENAVALATMVGGIDLSDAVSGLDGDLFPFAGPEYRPDLVGAMLDVPPAHEVLPPWEPDLVGEWFVLSLLRKQNAFDDRPQQLMMSAEALSAADPVYAEQFAAFRIRALHDFDADVPIELLFREPSVDAPPHAHAAWAASLADSALPLLQHEGLVEQFLERLRQLQASYLADSDVQVGICDAMQGICRAYLHVGAYHRALGLFSEVLEWTVAVDGLTSKAHSDMGWSVGRLGVAVGRTQIEGGRIVHATKTFESLRIMAHHLWKLGVEEKEEIANCAAELGLHIRRYFRSNGYSDAAAAYDRALWGQPLSDSIDLAEASGEVLMHWSHDGTFGTQNEVYEELKRRSQRRPDAKAIAFWAANVGYTVTRDAEETGDARTILDAVAELREWITTRADWPDMADIVWEAICHDWICENHSLGRVPLEAMLELWREAKARGGESNEEAALRMDLLDALKACGDKETVVKIRASMSASS